MLINKGFTKGDVITLKMVNGDEVIARFENEDADTITIDRPQAVTIGQGGLGLIPWLFLAETTQVTLKKNHIFFSTVSKKDASDQYLKGTTGIAMV
jgi:hypothetical protein